MRHRTRYLVLAGSVLLGLALFMEGTAWSTCRRIFARPMFVQAAEQAQPGKGAGKDDPAKEAVMANVRAFTDGYNRRDIKSILGLFAEDCVLTEADGPTLNGL
jgi:hypothetical protein